jgi:hypothetical protein
MPTKPRRNPPNPSPVSDDARAQTTISQSDSYHPTYTVHPMVDYVMTMIQNLPEKTGRSLQQWVAVVKKEKSLVQGAAGATDAKAINAFLKQKHGLGGTTASLITDHMLGLNAERTDGALYLTTAAEMVDAMYAGPKADLRPLHDLLIQEIVRRRPDCRISPCKTIVPIYRNRVVAQIKPTTNKRIDLGLALQDAKGKLPKRLIDTGGAAKKDRITHRIEVTNSDDVDDQLWKWFDMAYDLDKN